MFYIVSVKVFKVKSNKEQLALTSRVVGLLQLFYTIIFENLLLLKQYCFRMHLRVCTYIFALVFLQTFI